MNANQNMEMASMTKREIIKEIGDQATFVKKEKLERMVLTKRARYLMIGMRIYIVALLTVIILSLLR
ncbi:MAG: hypothetical protein M1354_00685 [Candidatus Marsarchaeota archaeon]|nr:hypothetical protein [Candidatus Marsarchaeota archaeon]